MDGYALGKDIVEIKEALARIESRLSAVAQAVVKPGANTTTASTIGTDTNKPGNVVPITPTGPSTDTTATGETKTHSWYWLSDDGDHNIGGLSIEFDTEGVKYKGSCSGYSTHAELKLTPGLWRIDPRDARRIILSMWPPYRVGFTYVFEKVGGDFHLESWYWIKPDGETFGEQHSGSEDLYVKLGTTEGAQSVASFEMVA